MMKPFIFALSAALSACAFSQPIDSNAVVAKIDGQTITAAQFYHRMAYMDGIGTVEDGKFVAAPPAFLTLRRMIDEAIILMVAKDKGVAPTAAEIQAEVAKRKAENPEKLRDLQALGITDDVIVSQVTQDLARFNLLTMGVTITDAQVTDHYNVNKLIYVEPATTKLKVIVVDEAADKAKVDEALKTKAFAEVAKTMSTDLTKLMGGDLPEVPTANLPDNVKTAIASVAAGKTTAWMESGGSFLKYLVEAKKEQKQVPLDAALKADIKKRMMVVAGQQKNGEMVEGLIKQKRKAVNVQITAPGLQKLWNLLASR
jgi:foldase protein PrsA